jgi:hypothetical protein
VSVFSGAFEQIGSEARSASQPSSSWFYRVDEIGVYDCMVVVVFFTVCLRNVANGCYRTSPQGCPLFPCQTRLAQGFGKSTTQLPGVLAHCRRLLTVLCKCHNLWTLNSGAWREIPSRGFGVWPHLVSTRIFSRLLPQMPKQQACLYTTYRLQINER